MKQKLIFEDSAGNKLFVRESEKKKVISYYGRNATGQLMCEHGLRSMMKEKGISTKDLIKIYKGTKRSVRK